MRILQVITSLKMGGAEKLVSELVPALTAKGHVVDVALFDGADTPFKRDLIAAGVSVVSFSNGGSVYNPKRILQLRRIIRNYDIVHTHNAAPQFAAAVLGRKTSAFLITTEHSTSNRRRVMKLFPRALDRWMYRRYDRIVCISDKATENLITYLGGTFPASRISTIYNGVDLEKFRKAKPFNRHLISPSSEKKYVVTMVAGFRPAKDQDSLIRAISKLPPDEYELWLVGDGPRRRDLERLVSDLHVKNVFFLGIRNDVPAILKTSDLIVMSSHYEGLSLSSIEGMCGGKPFVASDVDGLHEVVKGAGVLFPHENDSMLAKIIEDLRLSKDLADRIANACKKRADLYDIRKTVEAYHRMYSHFDQLDFDKSRPSTIDNRI